MTAAAQRRTGGSGADLAAVRLHKLSIIGVHPDALPGLELHQRASEQRVSSAVVAELQADGVDLSAVKVQRHRTELAVGARPHALHEPSQGLTSLVPAPRLDRLGGALIDRNASDRPSRRDKAAP